MTQLDSIGLGIYMGKKGWRIFGCISLVWRVLGYLFLEDGILYWVLGITVLGVMGWQYWFGVGLLSGITVMEFGITLPLGITVMGFACFRSLGVVFGFPGFGTLGFERVSPLLVA